MAKRAQSRLGEALLALKAVEVANDLNGNAELASLIDGRGFTVFSTHGGQFPRIEPVTGAVRTLVDFDAAFGAEEMAMEFDARTARTFPLARLVDKNVLTALDPQERLTGNFTFVIDLLEFKGIQPNASTTALADVHGETTDLQFGEFIVAGWAFHNDGRFRGTLARMAGNGKHSFGAGAWQMRPGATPGFCSGESPRKGS